MKALVIKTGEIFEIKSEHQEFVLSFCTSLDKPNNDIHSTTEVKDYYILSNGKKYCESELIIDMLSIRDFKLNNIL